MIKSMIFDYQSEADLYTAKDIRAVYKNFMSNGVLLEKDDDISTNTKCKVVPITGGVKISSGVVSINGSQAIVEDEDVLITENGTYKIVLEWNLVLNKFIAKYIESETPLSRTDTVYQIQLAEVVKSGATYTVTDTRADGDVCGYANKMLDNQVDCLQHQIDGIADYPVERGTDGTWTWKKWESGDFEAKCIQTIGKIEIADLDNNWYHSSTITQEFPFTLAEPPIVLPSLTNTGLYYCDVMLATVDNTRFVYRLTANKSVYTSIETLIGLKVEGKWK